MATAIRPERNGQDFELIVCSMLRQRGADFERQRWFRPSIYGYDWKVDVFVKNAESFRNGLVIECKWQESDGSADEKLPYLVANIRTLPCPAIIIAGGRDARIAGHGARAGALKWLQAQIDEHLIAVLTLEQLLPWLRRQTFSRPVR